MSRTFAVILAISLAFVGGLVWYAVVANQNHLVTLKGSVLKVRTLPLTAQATLVLVDFRIANPSQVPFDVKYVELEMDPKNPSGDTTKQPKALPGDVLTKSELDRVFEYEKRIGPRENKSLGAGDRILAGESQDRMVAARFDVPEAEVVARTRLRIRIREFEGLIAEFVELHPAAAH